MNNSIPITIIHEFYIHVDRSRSSPTLVHMSYYTLLTFTHWLFAGCLWHRLESINILDCQVSILLCTASLSGEPVMLLYCTRLPIIPISLVTCVCVLGICSWLHRYYYWKYTNCVWWVRDGFCVHEQNHMFTTAYAWSTNAQCTHTKHWTIVLYMSHVDA